MKKAFTAFWADFTNIISSAVTGGPAKSTLIAVAWFVGCCFFWIGIVLGIFGLFWVIGSLICLDFLAAVKALFWGILWLVIAAKGYYVKEKCRRAKHGEDSDEDFL